MSDANTNTNVRQRAEELAASGEHSDYRSIAFALECEGHADAYNLLQDEQLRRKLNATCDCSRADC